MDETRNLPLVQDIILDLTESQLDVVYANQYDNSGRIVNLHIQDEGIDFDCSGYTVELFVKKSNGKGLSRTIGKVDEEGNIFGSVSGNIVSFPIDIAMTYSYGRQECSLAFVSDTVTYSCKFYLRINEGTVDNKTIIDSDDYQTIHDEYLELKNEIPLASNLGSSISLSIDNSTYIMTLSLKNSDGDVLSSETIDFPIESMVINASYVDGTLTLTLKNGNTVDVDISDIISGLVPDSRTIAGIDLKEDITIEAGENITLTTDEDNHKITISSSGGIGIASTVTGNNPTATNSTDGSLIYLKVNGYTVQNGEPTPNNPIDIVGIGDSGTIIIATTNEDDTQSTTANIPISAPLYEGDYIEAYADGSGQIVRSSYTETFDGSDDEMWISMGDGLGGFWVHIPCTNEPKEDTLAYCTRFKNNANGKDYTGDNIFISASFIYISPSSIGITSANKWKEWLQSNPITVVYQSTTPTTEPLTAEQVAEFMKLQTFKGVTHVNADGEITVRYYCNNDSGETVEMLHGMIPNIVAGSNISIDKDENTNKITISSTANSIDDSSISTDTTWSSNKLNAKFNNELPTLYQDKDVDIIVNNKMAGWENIYTDTNGVEYKSICYENGIFVAVGETNSGGGYIIYSTNGGISWNVVDNVSISYALNCVAYGNGRFIALGNRGICFYSDDGMNWVEGATTTGDFSDIVYGDGKFATCSTSGNWKYTVDGTSWSNNGGSCYEVQSITYGKGLFVAASSAATYALHYSYDGFNWSAYSGNGGNFYCVRFLNGMFIAVGASTIYYSEDGQNWNEGSGITATCKGVAYGNGLYVAVSSDSTTTFYSKDGITWSTTVDDVDITPLTTYQNRVVYGEGTFVSTYNGGLSATGFVKQHKNIEDAINELYNNTSSGGSTGVDNKMDKENPTGTGSLSMNRKADTTIGYNSATLGYDNEASGNYSHAEGAHTTASGNYSHAEGDTTTASNFSSHAEGNNTTASNYASHAEGCYTTASGNYSHAEGNYTTASGDCSHAGGSNTTAGYGYQTVIGKYNDNKSTSIFEIGNGTSSEHSNALELTTEGQLTTSGDIINGNGVSLDGLIDKLTWKTRIHEFTETGINISCPELLTANEIRVVVEPTTGTKHYQYMFLILPNQLPIGNPIEGYSASNSNGTYSGCCELAYNKEAVAIAILNLSVGNTSYTEGKVYITYR